MENKKTVIDIRRALMQYEINSGEQKTHEQLSGEKSITKMTLHNWSTKHSVQLKFLLDVANETGLTIQQLLKEI